MKKFLSLIMVLVITACSASVCYAETGNGLSVAEVKAAGNKALEFLQEKQGKLKDNEYTVLASYYPGKAEKAVAIELRNCGFTYDNALAALAFIAAGDKNRAGHILDCFKYALLNDRSGEMKLRNAYRDGNYSKKYNDVLLPGFWKDSINSWCEDSYQVGTNLGNSAWAAIAMLQYDRVFKTDTYQKSACRVMDYVLDNFKGDDSNPGIASGYDGWTENGPQNIPLKDRKDVQWYTYKSTECNLDAAVAFGYLYQQTKDSKYKTASEDCWNFLESMYIPSEKRYVIGTTNDGITKNTRNSFFDSIAWPILASANKSYNSDLSSSIKNMTTEGGLPFVCLGIPSDKKFDTNGGIWYEGSIFGSMALKKAGYNAEADDIMKTVIGKQDTSGAFTSASKLLFADNTWKYGCEDFHIAPTAWMVMYSNDFNPFDFSNTPAPVVKKPVKPSKVTIKAAKKKLTVKWAKPSKKNLKNISAYQIRYSTESSMENAVVVKVAKSKKSATIKKLISKKKYYVQMRSVNGDSSSAWTTKKSIKAK